MLKQKLEELGFIFSNSYSTSSAYLLEDGSFLNLQYQKPLKNNNQAYHLQLDNYIKKNNLIDPILYNEYLQDNPKIKPFRGGNRILLYTDNACVLNDGEFAFFESFFLELPPKMPAEKQLEQLII